MKINRNGITVVSLSIASVLLIMGLGYSIGQTSSSPRELNTSQDGTPTNRAGLVVSEIPMDVIPGEGTPPGSLETGETPIGTSVPPPAPTAAPTTVPTP